MDTKAHEFRTITGADWAAMFRRERAHSTGSGQAGVPNAVSVQIQTRLRALRSDAVSADPGGTQKILNVKLGKTPFDRLRAGESEGARVLPTEHTEHTEKL